MHVMPSMEFVVHGLFRVECVHRVPFVLCIGGLLDYWGGQVLAGQRLDFLGRVFLSWYWASTPESVEHRLLWPI